MKATLDELMAGVDMLRQHMEPEVGHMEGADPEGLVHVVVAHMVELWGVQCVTARGIHQSLRKLH